MDSAYSFCIPKQRGGLAMVELIFSQSEDRYYPLLIVGM